MKEYEPRRIREKLPVDWEQVAMLGNSNARIQRVQQALAVAMLELEDREVPSTLRNLVNSSSLCRAKRVLICAPGRAVRELFQTAQARLPNGKRGGLDKSDHAFDGTKNVLPVVLPHDSQLRNEFFQMLSDEAIAKAWQKQAAMFLAQDLDGKKEDTVRFNELYQQLFKSKGAHHV